MLDGLKDVSKYMMMVSDDIKPQHSRKLHHLYANTREKSVLYHHGNCLFMGKYFDQIFDVLYETFSLYDALYFSQRLRLVPFCTSQARQCWKLVRVLCIPGNSTRGKRNNYLARNWKKTGSGMIRNQS